MRVGGIIAEYNPFHRGHRYQIERYKQEHGITHLVVVMSGNYVQRGDVALVDKYTRANWAIQGGANLVLELPVAYALSTAERFAFGGVYLLHSLGCVGSLSFGSSSDIGTLVEVARLSEELRNSEEVLTLQEQGVSFPNAISRVLANQYGEGVSNVLSDPNNVLGVEYVRALDRLHSTVRPTTLSRKCVQHHDTMPMGGFASASTIRRLILTDGDYHQYVPQYVEGALSGGSVATLRPLDRLALYRLRTATLEDYRATPDVSHGLEYRMLKATKEATSLEGWCLAVKSKRYTLARIRRVVLNLLLGITSEDTTIVPQYARVLAMDSKGVEVLSKAKRSGNIPLGTSLAKLAKLSPEAERFARLESLSTDVYYLATQTVRPCGLDYTHKTTITQT